MTSDENTVNLATADLFQSEIARLAAVNDRLRAEIERLRARPCPYVTGNVTQHCTLTPLTLTDAEREAVERAISREIDAEWYGGPEPERVTVLRALLERSK